MWVKTFAILVTISFIGCEGPKYRLIPENKRIKDYVIDDIHIDRGFVMFDNYFILMQSHIIGDGRKAINKIGQLKPPVELNKKGNNLVFKNDISTFHFEIIPRDSLIYRKRPELFKFNKQ